jgi:PTH1 family peptidyl-tRNA hydrolase
MDKVRLIVGLGNPGAQYAATRHNAGAWWIDQFAEQHHIPLHLDRKFRGFVGEWVHDHQKCFLLKPTTYMNESGLAVSVFSQFYKINPNEILVAHDEMDFEPGDVRLKQGGGHGGHNGLRDIISHLHTQDYYRLRLGIGRAKHRDQVTDYVLGNPSRDDRDKIFKAIDESIAVIPDLLSGKIQQAFHQLHSD